MGNMFAQSDTDTIERAAESYNLMSILIVAMMVGVIIALAVSLYVAHKKTAMPMRKIKNFDHYNRAKGSVTDVEEERYFVKPYVSQPKLLTSDTDKKNKETFSAVEKQLAEKAMQEISKPLEKRRFKVTYTFAAESFGDGFYGEFVVYKESDLPRKGSEVEVMYDPESPQVNFTKYNEPV